MLEVGLAFNFVLTTVLLVAVARLAKQVGTRALDDARAGAGLATGTAAPDWTLPALESDGTSRSLAALALPGTPLLVVFSSSSCTACDTALPEVASSLRRRRSPLSSVLVAEGEEDKMRVKPYIHGFTAAVYDEDGAVRREWKVDGTPAAQVVGGDGRISSRLALGEFDIRALIEEL